MEKELNELVTRLKKAAGTNLTSVVLFGSAASGQYQPGHSDLNVLCTLEHLDGRALEALRPAVQWWTAKGNPQVLMFPMDELRCSADVFAIELLDIKARHKVLYGEDSFAGLNVPMDLHRVEVEHELRTKLIRLRQAYLEVAGDPKRLLSLLTDSVTSFLTLFRHTLIALGEEPPAHRHDVLDRLAARFSVDVSPFHAALDVREGKRRPKNVDVTAVARAYLESVGRITDEVDRCGLRAS
ncbi:MAG TPA: nucleotidyltransferase domain-containing protein [Terriglobales bacterium]|nr:nucleotidyltransferase domain-containing protein [Terriglobales bacterium]